MIRAILLLALLFFGGCSDKPKEKIKIGVDSSWYPLNFGKQNAYVNGFTDELLLEVARHMHVEFEKLPATHDTLFFGLKEKRYNAVLTSLPPYTYNLAKYDFSQNILRVGPVLIVSTGAKKKKLDQMEWMTIGILAGDDPTLILRKYPNIMTRSYMSTIELLNAVVGGDVSGALLDRIPAVGYTTDLYQGKLIIATIPLDHAGIHLIAEKGKHEAFVKSFNDSITFLKKKKFYKDLLQKWSL